MTTKLHGQMRHHSHQAEPMVTAEAQMPCIADLARNRTPLGADTRVKAFGCVTTGISERGIFPFAFANYSFKNEASQEAAPMMAEKTVYIAETDELGCVVCVWHADKHSRAKPLKAPLETKPHVTPSQCFGASREDVAAWIQSHLT